MTRDDIIRLAREAGGLDLLCAHNGFTDTLIHFAALVAAAEREACAKVVEQYTGAWSDEGYALAAAIRARGQE
jgi:hypothetical protein